MASGIFDADWYRQQTSDELPTVAAALTHYLNVGRRNLLTPSPLFDPSWYDPLHWAHTTSDPLARYLFRGPGRYGPHPLFDDGRWLAAHPEAARHPGRALGHFLSTAGDDVPVPVPAEMPGLPRGELISLIRDASERWTADAYAARRRRGRHRDAGPERRFRARWASVPPPSGGDGPLVSVVTPVRNRATQVLAAIASVQAQSISDWEMIVVDDGSTDGTPAAVEVIADADHRVRIVRIPPSGVSLARNAGIAAARGRYVAFLDSDNLWVRDFLQLMTAAMHGLGLRAAYSALEMVDGELRHYLAFRGDLDDLAYGNHVDLNTLVVERSLLLETGGFDPGLRRMVDYDLVVRLYRHSPVQLLDFIGAVYHAGEEFGPRISTTESLSWDQAVKNRLFLDWSAQRRAVQQRVTGRTSVLLASSATARLTLRAVEHLQRHVQPGEDVEIVVLDNGGRRSTWMQLYAMLALRPGLVLTRSARDEGPVLGANLAFAASSGDVVVVVEPEVVVDAPWVAPLRAALADPRVGAAQPIVVDTAGLVHSAGVAAGPILAPSDGTSGEPSDQDGVLDQPTGPALPPGTAVYAPLLAGFPPEDAERLTDTRLAAAVGPMTALRAADVAAAGGLDPLLGTDAALADLCWQPGPAEPGALRQTDLGTDERRFGALIAGHPVRVVPGLGAESTSGRLAFPIDAHELRILRDRPLPPPTGLDVPDPWAPTGLTARGVRGPFTVVERLEPAGIAEPPRLRWAIKTAAPAGPKGDAWGDVHFAAATARALENSGQLVVVDRREGVTRPTAQLDDVVVVLRGLDQVEPVPGAVNLLWVISHPDLVTPEEMAGFDRVFAASVDWAARISQSAGVNVEPLLQATDPRLFRPDSTEPGSGPPVLFVGNSRDVLRPMVRDALAAGLPLTIYGTRWQKLVDPRYVAGELVRNDRLGALYRSAGVVLNDHWEDMAREGFLSNRLFDAVAAGARVISDPVPGLETVFGPEVRVVNSPEELSRAVAESVPDELLLAAAERVRREHSFEHRAEQLMEAVHRVREARLARQVDRTLPLPNGAPNGTTTADGPAESGEDAARQADRAVTLPAGTESGLR